jgi:hypothetical protein
MLAANRKHVWTISGVDHHGNGEKNQNKKVPKGLQSSCEEVDDQSSPAGLQDGVFYFLRDSEWNLRQMCQQWRKVSVCSGPVGYSRSSLTVRSKAKLVVHNNICTGGTHPRMPKDRLFCATGTFVGVSNTWRVDQADITPEDLRAMVRNFDACPPVATSRRMMVFNKTAEPWAPLTKPSIE